MHYTHQNTHTHISVFSDDVQTQTGNGFTDKLWLFFCS